MRKKVDNFQQRVKNAPSVTFVKTKVTRIEQGQDGTSVLHGGCNTEGYHRYATPPDLLVLAIGMEPSVSDFLVKVTVNESGFIEQDKNNGAIYAVGCSSDALDVNRAVQSMTVSALRAIQVVNRFAGRRFKQWQTNGHSRQARWQGASRENVRPFKSPLMWALYWVHSSGAAG